MDYLQYELPEDLKKAWSQLSFKPCYKWITFNTDVKTVMVLSIKLEF